MVIYISISEKKRKKREIKRINHKDTWKQHLKYFRIHKAGTLFILPSTLDLLGPCDHLPSPARPKRRGISSPGSTSPLIPILPPLKGGPRIGRLRESKAFFLMSIALRLSDEEPSSGLLEGREWSIRASGGPKSFFSGGGIKYIGGKLMAFTVHKRKEKCQYDLINL